VAKTGERKTKGRSARPARALPRFVTLLAALAVFAQLVALPYHHPQERHDLSVVAAELKATFGPTAVLCTQGDDGSSPATRDRQPGGCDAGCPLCSSLRTRRCSKPRRPPCPSDWRTPTVRRRPMPTSCGRAAARDPFRPAQSPAFSSPDVKSARAPSPAAREPISHDFRRSSCFPTTWRSIAGAALALRRPSGYVCVRARCVRADRIFPATLGIDDPGVGDELALPTFDLSAA